MRAALRIVATFLAVAVLMGGITFWSGRNGFARGESAFFIILEDQLPGPPIKVEVTAGEDISIFNSTPKNNANLAIRCPLNDIFGDSDSFKGHCVSLPKGSEMSSLNGRQIAAFEFFKFCFRKNLPIRPTYDVCRVGFTDVCKRQRVYQLCWFPSGISGWPQSSSEFGLSEAGLDLHLFQLALHDGALALHCPSLGLHHLELVGHRSVSALAGGLHFSQLAAQNPELQSSSDDENAGKHRQNSSPSSKPTGPFDQIPIKLVLGYAGLVAAVFGSCLAAWCITFWVDRWWGWWLLSIGGFVAAIYLTFQCAPLVFAN